MHNSPSTLATTRIDGRIGSWPPTIFSAELKPDNGEIRRTREAAQQVEHALGDRLFYAVLAPIHPFKLRLSYFCGALANAKNGEKAHWLRSPVASLRDSQGRGARHRDGPLLSARRTCGLGSFQNKDDINFKIPYLPKPDNAAQTLRLRDSQVFAAEL